MKYLIAFFIVCTSACKAQTIIPMYDPPEDFPEEPYFKDLDNNLGTVEGTWVWRDTNASLQIQLAKVEMILSSTGNYFDELIGEYKYIINGLEVVNTLPLVPNTENTSTHHIVGGVITTKNRGFPPCPECAEGTRFIRLIITDGNYPRLYGSMVFAHFVENGIEKLRMRILNTHNDYVLTDPDYDGPDVLAIPEGVYTFIKQ